MAENKKQWRTPSKHGNAAQYKSRNIQPGDSGIWATCDRGRERKCIGELRDLFNEYAELLYPDNAAESGSGDKAEEPVEDLAASIENEIKQEIEGIKKPKTANLFTPVELDVVCVVFFKTVKPVEPVSFVHRIMQDAANNPQRKRTRFTKRLVPMTMMGRASEEGLASVATEVLGPQFHLDSATPKKFAIRPSLRNHNLLKRDNVIQQVAAAVGPGHSVDLKNYDLLILVELYTNICGMSVVPGDFETLKRYNLAEIFDPTPKDETTKGEPTKDEPTKDEPIKDESIKDETTKGEATRGEGTSGDVPAQPTQGQLVDRTNQSEMELE